jgi:CBS domain containing-hemolysin-like protein
VSLGTLASLGVAILLLVAHGVLAAAKSAFANSRRSRLRQMALDEVPRAQLAAELAEDASRMLGTLHLGKALLLAFALAVVSLTLVTPLSSALGRIGLPDPWTSALSLMVVVCSFAIIQLIVSRLVPEAVAAANPEKWALRLALLVRVLELGLWPLVRFTVWVSNRLAAPFGGTPLGGLSSITEEEIKTLVDAGEEEGVIEEDEREMIYSIFEFGETLAREVMVPRIDMVALNVSTPLDKALMAIIDAGHSRIPVYEGTVDHIVGLLYAKDLLAYMVQGDPEPPLRTLLRPAYFVPETKKVDDLLREMQQRRVHLTVVVDEYGGTAGLVTVEDILEEIVGEIQDEYDAEEPIFEQTGENEYVLDARMDLDDVNNLLQTDLPTEVGDTLGGLIYSSLGKVPAPGEQLRMNGLLIEVLTVTGRRIRKVRLKKESVEGVDG